MKRALIVLMIAFASVFAGASLGSASTPVDDATFTIVCAKMGNVCTFTSTSGQNGQWIFSDFSAYPWTGVTLQKAMSTHDLATGTTPYTTNVTHVVGTDTKTGSVKCTAIGEYIKWRCQPKVDK